MPADTHATKALEYYRTEAQAALAEGEPVPEPARLGQMTEGVLNELELAKKDDTKELFEVPETKNQHWPGLLKELAQELYRAQGEPAPQTPPPIDAPGQVKLIVELCEEERKRLGRTIEGNRSQRRRAAALREHIFGGRPTPQSRPAWEAELNQNIFAIEGLGAKAPPAVRAMVPRLKRVQKLLNEAPVIAPGRQKPVPTSPKLQLAAMALHLALGDLLSHAATTATSKRLASLSRIILPRKRDDGREGEASEPAAPEEGASSGDDIEQPPTGLVA